MIKELKNGSISNKRYNKYLTFLICPQKHKLEVQKKIKTRKNKLRRRIR